MRARSGNVNFCPSSVDSCSRCAVRLANSILKIKTKIGQVDRFSKLSLNMVVIWLKLLIFWSLFQIWTRKCELPKFLIFSFFTTTCMALRECLGIEEWEAEFEQKFHYCCLKVLLEFRSNEKHASSLDLVIICLVFYPNLNFLATHMLARSEIAYFCPSSVDSSRRAARLSRD